MCAYSGVPVTAIFCHRTRKSAITACRITNLISPGSIEEITVDQVWSTLVPYLSLNLSGKNGHDASC